MGVEAAEETQEEVEAVEGTLEEVEAVEGTLEEDHQCLDPEERDE